MVLKERKPVYNSVYRILCFNEKTWKRENSAQCSAVSHAVAASACTSDSESSHPLTARVALPGSFPRTTLSISALSPTTVNFVCICASSSCILCMICLKESEEPERTRKGVTL